MIAVIEAENITRLNDTIDRIGELGGVTQTTTSILLAAKLRR